MQRARNSQSPCVVCGKRIATKGGLGGLRNIWQELASR